MFQYTNLFPNFLTEMTQLNNVALMVAYTILLGSFILSAHSAAEGGKVLMHIYKYAALIAAIVASPTLADTFSGGIWQLANSMDSNIGQQTYDQMMQEISTQTGTGTGPSDPIFTITGGFNGIAFFRLIVSAVFMLFMFICIVIIWVVYLFQFGFVKVMEAFLPMAIACLATQGWSSWGIRWITTLLGIMSWPIGMTIVLIGTENLMTTNVFNTAELGSPFLASIAVQAKMGFAAVYTIIGLCVAPAAISGVADSGGSIGGALASGGMQLGAQIAGTVSSITSSAASSGGTSGGGGNGGGDQAPPPPPKPADLSRRIPEVSTTAAKPGGGGGGESSSPSPTFEERAAQVGAKEAVKEITRPKYAPVMN